MSMVVVFKVYVRPLEAVLDLKYLGRVLTASDDYWTVVVVNLRKSRSQWARLPRILGQ